MIFMEMMKSFSYLHRTLIACLFLRVTHTKIRRMRKMAVRMEDSGSYLKIMIMMIVALVMTMTMRMVMMMMVMTLVMMTIMRVVIVLIGGID